MNSRALKNTGVCLLTAGLVVALAVAADAAGLRHRRRAVATCGTCYPTATTMGVAPRPVPAPAGHWVEPVYWTPNAAAPAAAADWLAELNAIRARAGLAPVGYDPAMVADSAANNAHQAARGLGHHHMGRARRQNAAMGAHSLMARWMASPGHRAAILDPSVRLAGLAVNGPWATLSLR